MERLRGYARVVFGLDTRSLALMRVGLGAVVLADLAIRAVDLRAMYTGEGILPRAERIALFGDAWAWSLYDLVAGDITATALLFGVVALAAVAVVLGIGTRAALGICLISSIGLRIRMPLASTGGDVLLNALLLWSLFLPLDARWSLAARRRREAGPASVCNLASFALLLQIGVLFVFAGGAKLHDPAWRAGDGVYYALTAEFYTTELAGALLGAAPGWLLGALTYAVIGFEIAGPLLLLIPRRVNACRLAFVRAAVLMNLSFWLCLRIGIFSWVVMIGCVAALPGALWDRLERRPQKTQGTAAPLPSPIQALLAVLIALMLLNNLRAPRFLGVGAAVGRVSLLLGLDQRGWPMFSPTARDHGWFVIAGRRADGRSIDLYRGGRPLQWERPSLLSAEFATYRRRKYYMNIRRGAAPARDLLLRFHCREHNRAHRGAERVEALILVYMREETLPGYRTVPARRVVLAARRCR